MTEDPLGIRLPDFDDCIERGLIAFFQDGTRQQNVPAFGDPAFMQR
jgi:hypothetical protein